MMSGDSKPYAPLFLQQTYAMVNDPTTDEVIAWSGPDSFIIKDQNALASDVLPKYFKHNNFSRYGLLLVPCLIVKALFDSWTDMDFGKSAQMHGTLSTKSFYVVNHSYCGRCHVERHRKQMKIGHPLLMEAVLWYRLGAQVLWACRVTSMINSWPNWRLCGKRITF